jgi:hypothetical protein
VDSEDRPDRAEVEAARDGGEDKEGKDEADRQPSAAPGEG